MDINQYIETLTDDEKIKFKDLIEVCKTRDKKISKDSEERNKILQKLQTLEKDMIENIVLIDILSKKIFQNISGVYLKSANINSLKQ